MTDGVCAVYSSNPDAVKNEAAFLTRDLPALFLPNNDVVVAWRSRGISHRCGEPARARSAIAVVRVRDPLQLMQVPHCDRAGHGFG
jgi:hypothetical protein